MKVGSDCRELSLKATKEEDDKEEEEGEATRAQLVPKVPVRMLQLRQFYQSGTAFSHSKSKEQRWWLFSTPFCFYFFFFDWFWLSVCFSTSPNLARRWDCSYFNSKNSAHPSCQRPTENIFNHCLFSIDSLNNQLPFSCEEARKRLLLAALKAPEQDEDQVLPPR